MDLRGAVAVVTGASAGIGRATSMALAAEGATVVLAARREPLLRQVADEIADRGGQALSMACDVTSRDQVDALRGRVEVALGRCDVLVNNAGVPGGGRFDEVSVEQVERVVRTNYLGVVYCTKAFLPMMLAAGKGHVVNVASLAGLFPVPGSAIYSSTKHAVVAFSEALYFELAERGVLVTSVNPGLVVTEGCNGSGRRGFGSSSPRRSPPPSSTWSGMAGDHSDPSPGGSPPSRGSGFWLPRCTGSGSVGRCAGSARPGPEGEERLAQGTPLGVYFAP